MSVLVVSSIIFKQRNKAAHVGFLILSLVLLGRYAAEFPFGMYRAGATVSGGRELAKTLRQRARQDIVRIGASLDAEPIVNYYRRRYRQANWQPVERGPLTGAYDYYVLTPADAALIEERHLHVLYRDQGLTLAQ